MKTEDTIYVHNSWCKWPVDVFFFSTSQLCACCMCRRFLAVKTHAWRSPSATQHLRVSSGSIHIVHWGCDLKCCSHLIELFQSLMKPVTETEWADRQLYPPSKGTLRGRYWIEVWAGAGLPRLRGGTERRPPPVVCHSGWGEGMVGGGGGQSAEVAIKHPCWGKLLAAFFPLLYGKKRERDDTSASESGSEILHSLQVKQENDALSLCICLYVLWRLSQEEMPFIAINPTPEDWPAW